MQHTFFSIWPYYMTNPYLWACCYGPLKV